MDIKLNNSELATILSLIDNEFRDYEDDPLVVETMKSIITKINDRIRYQVNKGLDEYTTSMVRTYVYEEGN